MSFETLTSVGRRLNWCGRQYHVMRYGECYVALRSQRTNHVSLGALLAIDFAIRHEEKVASLILIGAQYKVPSLLIDFQNLIFRCMPNKVFESMGLSKSSTIKLAHSMRSLDFTSQLNNIRCPVTILCGKKDTANLKASKRLKELLPQATLHIVPNAGHELNKYAPNTIAEILNQ